MYVSSRSSVGADGKVEEPGGGRQFGAGVLQLGLADAEHDVATPGRAQRRRVGPNGDDDGRQRVAVSAGRRHLAAGDPQRRPDRLQQVRLRRRQLARIHQRHHPRPRQRSDSLRTLFSL